MMEEIKDLELSKCIVCQSPQRHLKLLLCHHTICPSCIRTNGGPSMSCPKCGAVTEVGELRPNSFVECLFEYGDVLKSLPNCYVCTRHDRHGIPGLYSCCQCFLAMCEGCKEIHNDFHHNHTVVFTKNKVKDEGGGQTQDTCKVHPGRPIDLLCTACQQFICMICPMVSSSPCPADPDGKHTCIELKEAIKLKRAELRQQLEAIEMEMSEVRDSVESLKSNLKKITTQGVSMKKLIWMQKEEIQKELDQRTEQLMKEADDITYSRRVLLEDSLSGHLDHLDMKAALCSKLSCAVEYYSPVDLQKEIERNKRAMKIALPETKCSLPEVVYKTCTGLSSQQTTLKDSMGQLIEEVRLTKPVECTSINDLAYSSFTKSYYISGAASGLWREVNGQLQRVDDNRSAGLYISKDGKTLYSAGGKQVSIFRLSQTGSLTEIQILTFNQLVQSVCCSDDDILLAIICNKSKTVCVTPIPYIIENRLEDIFLGGNPLYGTWTGDDRLYVTVHFKRGSDKVMCINADSRCVLWHVDVDNSWSISIWDHMLYTGKRNAAGIEVITKDGRKLGSIISKGLEKMLEPASGDAKGRLRAVHTGLLP